MELKAGRQEDFLPAVLLFPIFTVFPLNRSVLQRFYKKLLKKGEMERDWKIAAFFVWKMFGTP